ncbi:MAG: phosphotransferase [Anaerolineae bacterium]|jgi:Ser/Thr protein kinase RdoA (MazF antagonist)|nr:phosphotransferase [Anaerolineae bacterium]
MKPYEDLTRLGKIRRMRKLAQSALAQYELPDFDLRFLRQAGNTIYRVIEKNPETRSPDSPYLPGNYSLRIHQPGYQSLEAIQLEYAWLSAMSHEANLPVPQPVATKKGELVATYRMDGIPGERNISLLRWVKGRLITRSIKPEHFKAQGNLMAKLHAFSAHWEPPAGLTKRKFDWDGLFMDDVGEGIPFSKAWSLLPQHCIAPFKRITEETKKLMDRWGKSAEVYGLVHGDLGMDSNLLFWGMDAHAIDFDDSGFGYYMYDLSLSLEHIHKSEENYSHYRKALLDGYTQIRSLSEEEVNSLDLFLASYYVYYSLWAVIMIQRYPKYQQELLNSIERGLRYIKKYLAKV